MKLSVLIAAGGTGGHMVPAHALSDELMRRGHRVTLLTDPRGLRFPGLFEGVDKHVLPSASATGLNPVQWAKAIFALMKGRSEGVRVARNVKAQAVVGFGGYPSLPGLLAGISLRLPSIIHEQNAVLGRVNRNLQRWVSAVALSYQNTGRLVPGPESRVHFVGNPVREVVQKACATPYDPPKAGQPFRLLIVGGSQGAAILSKRVPEAVAALPAELRARLQICQQCRPEDLSAVVESYKAAGVEAECLTYMADLPERMASSHLLICRAGASTMAELMALGRPAILIPYPFATDDHQTANSENYVAAGAGVMLAEQQATASRLMGHLLGFMESPEALLSAAAAARSLGHPDSAARLADLVEKEVREISGNQRLAA